MRRRIPVGPGRVRVLLLGFLRSLSFLGRGVALCPLAWCTSRCPRWVMRECVERVGGLLDGLVLRACLYASLGGLSSVRIRACAFDCSTCFGFVPLRWSGRFAGCAGSARGSTGVQQSSAGWRWRRPVACALALGPRSACSAGCLWRGVLTCRCGCPERRAERRAGGACCSMRAGVLLDVSRMVLGFALAFLLASVAGGARVCRPARCRRCLVRSAGCSMRAGLACCCTPSSGSRSGADLHLRQLGVFGWKPRRFVAED